MVKKSFIHKLHIRQISISLKQFLFLNFFQDFCPGSGMVSWQQESALLHLRRVKWAERPDTVLCRFPLSASVFLLNYSPVLNCFFLFSPSVLHSGWSVRVVRRSVVRGQSSDPEEDHAPLSSDCGPPHGPGVCRRPLLAVCGIALHRPPGVGDYSRGGWGRARGRWMRGVHRMQGETRETRRWRKRPRQVRREETPS